jgi:hypothetical protein
MSECGGSRFQGRDWICMSLLLPCLEVGTPRCCLSRSAHTGAFFAYSISGAAYLEPMTTLLARKSTLSITV